MPMNFSYMEDGGILVHGEGVVTGSEIIEVNDKIYESPQKLERILYQLVDLTNVTKLLVSNEEVERLALQDLQVAKINPNMFIALVGHDDLVYGLARMWEALTHDAPFDTMVFRKLEDAEKWIKEKLPKP